MLEVPQPEDHEMEAIDCQKESATLQQFYTFQEQEQEEDKLEDEHISGDDQNDSFEMKYKAPTAPRGGGQNKVALFLDHSHEDEEIHHSDEKPIQDDEFEFDAPANP